MDYTAGIGKFKAIEHFAKQIQKTLSDIDKKHNAYGECTNPKKSISISNDIDRLKLLELTQRHELHRVCVNVGVADYNEERYKKIEYRLYGGHNIQEVDMRKPEFS